jgi:hypothetical protein
MEKYIVYAGTRLAEESPPADWESAGDMMMDAIV